MNTKKLKIFFKKNWHYISLVVLSFLFFLATSSFNFFTQSYNIDHPTYQDRKTDFVKWTSPDETGNYIFAKLYGQTGNISVEESYNLYTKDVMRPRSFRSDEGVLKPVSFLGIIIIYGKIVSFFGYKILPFLTPFFASIALIVFYFFVKLFFTRTNALISVFLLASFPPFFYYTARSMFHNVLFSCLFLFSIYFLMLMLRARKKKRALFDFSFKGQNWQGMFFASLSGLFLGLAVITRSSELIWLLPVYLIFFTFNCRKISALKVLMFFVFIFLGILPALFHNQILYGSFFFGGYNEMNESIIRIVQAGTNFLKNFIIGGQENGGEFVKIVGAQIFHFGIHPERSVRMFMEYFVKMFPWLFIMSSLGLIIYFINFRKIKSKIVLYLLSLSVLSFILVLYYGSWEFHDNPDPKQFTIGNSYTRYWLPMYIALIPFASFFLIKLSWALGALFKIPKKINLVDRIFYDRMISRKFFANSLRVVSVVVISFFSLSFVLYGSTEGLVQTAMRQIESKNEWQKVQELTESNSTIITVYHDKLMFPERKVIVGNFSDKNMVQVYSNLVNFLPVYYYNFTLPSKDLDYLNEKRLKEVGLGIEELERVTSDFTLYKLFVNSSSSPEVSTLTTDL